MNNPIRLNLRTITAAGFGLVLLLVGGYFLIHSWTRIFGIGIVMVGIGMISLGVTDGFSDYSPFGRVLYGVGIAGFALGVPLTVYAFYYGGF